MSLFTPESYIKQLIKEANEFTLSPDMEDTPIDNGAASMGLSDLPLGNSPMSAQAPAAPGMTPVNMPQPDASAPTAVTKTVINADLVLSHLSELKSVINNYEKRFGGDDVGIEDARVFISSFLNAMAYHAEKLQAFLNIPTSSSTEPAPTEMQDPMVGLGDMEAAKAPEQGGEDMPELPEMGNEEVPEV